jgi:hypothetical protein
MMFTPTLLLTTLVVVAILPKAAYSAQDTNYFAPGTSNPNIKNDHYYRDAINVIQDLSKFKALYVKFHSCA